MLGWITTRLQLDDAVTRQAQILEPSITAKRWNSRMRAESRLGVRTVTAVICHSDAFEF